MSLLLDNQQNSNFLLCMLLLVDKICMWELSFTGIVLLYNAS